jgi:hypothetical protein
MLGLVFHAVDVGIRAKDSSTNDPRRKAVAFFANPALVWIMGAMCWAAAA